MLVSYHNYRPSILTRARRAADPYKRYAELFEARYGLTGISRNYLLPQPLNAQLLEDYMHDHLHKAYSLCAMQIPGKPLREHQRATIQQAMAAARELIEAIKGLNPELKNIPTSGLSMEGLYDVVHGIATGFNPDDIEYWIESHPHGWLDKKPRRSEEKIPEELKPYNIERLHWFPCLKTLRSINAQIHEKLKEMPGVTVADFLTRQPPTFTESLSNLGKSLIQSVRQSSRSGPQSR